KAGGRHPKHSSVLGSSLVQRQEAAIDLSCLRGIADSKILLPEELGRADHVDLGAVAHGAGHRGATGHDAAGPAPELDAGADASGGYAQVAGRDPGSTSATRRTVSGDGGIADPRPPPHPPPRPPP